MAVENICSIERQIKSFNSLTKLVRSFIRCPRRTRVPFSLSLPLISTNSLQSSRKSLPRQLKPLPRRGSTAAAAAAAAADQQLLLLPRPAAPLEKSPKAEKNRCAIKVLFDSGQAPLLLELVSYDTVKTLRGVLKYEVRMRSLLGRAGLCFLAAKLRCSVGLAAIYFTLRCLCWNPKPNNVACQIPGDGEK